MASAHSSWSRRFGRLVVAGALSGASLALPAGSDATGKGRDASGDADRRTADVARDTRT